MSTILSSDTGKLPELVMVTVNCATGFSVEQYTGLSEVLVMLSVLAFADTVMGNPCPRSVFNAYL